MSDIVARKIITDDGEEIIELDLNKKWPSRKAGYASHMDEIENLTRSPRKSKKEFMMIVD